ncbi:MAG: glutathionylspermidine synthase family protein, partial [Candidatus Acidiferrum sp.]
MQSEDHAVLADFPLVLEEGTWQLLAQQAEQLAAEALTAEAELLGRPELHARLGLPRSLRKALRRCDPENAPLGCARVMRFDFHLTREGWRISEVNSDVPGGFIEAAGFAELMAEHYPECTPPPNPARLYADAIAAAAGEAAAVGLVHATAHSDDAQVMHYLGQELSVRGMRAIMIAPNHLRWNSGVARIASSFAAASPAALVRFFPAEWLPNLGPQAIWEPWFCGGRTAMSNPASAILIQSKRFPLAWDELATPVATWRALLPETKEPSALPTTWSADWVLKPVLGRVGESVAVPGVTAAPVLA